MKLKVCRGSPVRKVIRREVDSYEEASLILGTSKTHHRIRSSASVAKYCARKLSSRFTVLAVNNGKVIFQRLATFPNKGQSPGWNYFTFFSFMLLLGCESVLCLGHDFPPFSFA